jgi:hypothetical protein
MHNENWQTNMDERRAAGMVIADNYRELIPVAPSAHFYA